MSVIDIFLGLNAPTMRRDRLADIADYTARVLLAVVLIAAGILIGSAVETVWTDANARALEIGGE